MKLLGTLALLICSATAVLAADLGAKLTPMELDEGWVRLFDGATSFGWQGSGWKADGKGNLVSTGGTYQTTSPFGDFALRLRLKVPLGAKVALGLRCQASCAAVFPIDVPRETWENVELRVAGNTAKGKAVALPVEPGTGFLQLLTEDAGIEVSAITLLPLSMNPVKGWKAIFEKPVFISASRDGRIHLEGGPGEYQTESTFGDFVLQFTADIRSLPSAPEIHGGLFIRGDASKIFSGIKVVLDNRFVDKKPTNPKAFGTGGLYGKQAAREIFTRNRVPMQITVIAHGNHVATWVDGYPQADWTGDATEIRPRGVLGIEAADQYSNFTFSGFRIAEWFKD